MTTLRTMHKRRRRRERREIEPCCHTVVIRQAPNGGTCAFCKTRFPEYWWSDDVYDRDDWDEDDDGDCFHCGGEGYVDGYEDDPLWFSPGEMERCSSCGGSGRAKDMTIW